MEFLLLGPLEVSDGSGALPLGGPKQRTVLAHLLLQANRVVTADRLIDAIWADEPPDTARNTLQTYVRHLRRVLGSERIQFRSAGYVLRADPEEVDILRFQALVDESSRVAPTDLPAAIVFLREALGLWRGPPLDDLAEQPSLRSEIARLEEVRLAAVEDRIGADLALGRHREVIPELETLLGRHRYRERLWGQLILALYRSGRQGEALNAYQRARTVLMEELGIDPSPELQRLQEQILRQEPALDLGGKPLRGYRLLEQIGEGAFGTVHRAFQPEVGREVAVKVIGHRLADHPEFIRRFGVEAQMVARLEHPHIVPLYDYWREPEGAYLVMRYLRGGSLRQTLAKGPLADDRALRLTDQMALALASAHRQGVIHRDVKPANILFDEDANAYLSDFGIAKDLAAIDGAGDGGPSSAFDYYLSPEEARGEPPSHLADMYSLGIVLYESLTGRHPFADARPEELREKHAAEPFPSLRALRPDLPPAVDEVIAKATAKDPVERFDDIMALAAALREAWTRTAVAPSPAREGDLRNPYKGLHAFFEADAADFFGREASVRDVLSLMSAEVPRSRFLAVVGPSGSGKSSLVRAGLVPALRDGALPGSGGWFVVDMVPGARPFEELAAGLVRIAVDPRPGLLDRLEQDDAGLVRTAEEVLPADGSELLLVIDQFEEVFSLVPDEDQRARFLLSILAAAADPRSRVRVVVTMRADFYDRPLLYRGFGDLLAGRTYAVTPLSGEELERAVSGPATAVGATIESGLMTEIVAEVAGRPGALPLLQYALTEVFEGRDSSTLTLEAYHGVGGVSGALARRAESLHGRLNQAGKEATRQLFLRLVTVGEAGLEDTRRRVLRTELTSLEVDQESMEGVIDAFGARRLLSFDRDPSTRGPTVEIAHEALLGEWDRLRDWIEASREELRLHARVSVAANEWEEAQRSPDYLLAGSRLAQAAETMPSGSMKLTDAERQYLDASLAQQEAANEIEHARREREARLERRAFLRMRALVAVLAAASLVAASLTVVAVNRSREAERRRDEATVVGITGAALSNLRTHPDLSLLLTLHAVQLSADLGRPVPAATVEAMHWALQEAGVQYPSRQEKAVAVVGPLGTRGIFDLPLPRLLTLARANVTRQLSTSECEQFFGTATCPLLPRAFPADLVADPIRAVRSDLSRPLAGTQVTLGNVIDQPTWQIAFRRDVEEFTERTGIEIRLAGSAELEGPATKDLATREPADVAFLQPARVVELARQGRLMDLAASVDIDQLRRDQSPYLVSLGTIGPDGTWPSDHGRTWAAFVNLDVKGLIWYPVPDLREAGHSPPETWADMIALSDELVEAGQTPWCLGFASGEASGWPGTDWIENLLLAGAGPEVYDRWTFHRIPFDSPPVRKAFERLGKILFTKGYVYRGRSHALKADFGFAQLPMVEDDPPGCWLYQIPDFGATFLPPGSVGRDTEVFPFPRIGTHFRGGLLGAGTMLAGFADRPEVREVVRFLLSPEYGENLAGANEGFISANSRFDLAHYPPFWRHQAQLAYAALSADAFRFDASDLMPPPVGNGLFWDAMMTYLREGPGSLDRILADLDAAWPDG